MVNCTKNAELDNKYNGYSNYKLNSHLIQLKGSGADIAEIRYEIQFFSPSEEQTKQIKTSNW